MALFPSTFYKEPTKINLLMRFNIIIVKSMEKRLSESTLPPSSVTYGQPLSEGRRACFEINGFCCNSIPTGHFGSPLNVNSAATPKPAEQQVTLSFQLLHSDPKPVKTNAITPKDLGAQMTSPSQNSGPNMGSSFDIQALAASVPLPDYEEEEQEEEEQEEEEQLCR
jgi:hypothetical protein